MDSFNMEHPQDNRSVSLVNILSSLRCILEIYFYVQDYLQGVPFGKQIIIYFRYFVTVFLPFKLQVVSNNI